jgi:class 3 adenylate cyclase
MQVDMVGYTRRIGRDDEGTMLRIRSFRNNFLQPLLSRTGGLLRQTAGDSFLIVFDSIDGALQAALAIQKKAKFQLRASPDEPPMEFRIGIDMGDVFYDGTDVHGDNTIIAVRLENEAGPGEICVSRAIRDNARMRPDLRYEALGALDLKNVERPVEAFILRLEEPAVDDGLARVLRQAGRVLRSRRFGRRLKSYAAVLLATGLVAELGWISWRMSYIRTEQHTLPVPSDTVDTSKMTDKQRDLINDFAREHNVPIKVLEQILIRLGATNISSQPDEMWRQLDAKVKEYEELRNESALLSGDDPKVRDLRKSAAGLANQGDFEGARADLRLASRIDQQAVQMLTKHARERAFGSAQSLEDSAKIAALTLEFRDAARDLQDAAALVAPFEQHRQAELLSSAGRQLSQQGQYFGDADALRQAAVLLRRALELAQPLSDESFVYQIEQDLGDALEYSLAIGSSVGPTQEAVAAFRAALQWRTPDKAPMLWAHTTTRLAAALNDLGFLNSDPAPLREAIEYLRAVVKRLDPKQHPNEWADAQETLGIVLNLLDDFAPDKDFLKQGASAFRAALTERSRDRDLFAWVSNERALIDALIGLGQRDTGRAVLQDTIDETDRALADLPRARMPDRWASLVSHRAIAMTYLSLRETTPAKLTEAVELFRRALAQREQEQVTFPLADMRAYFGETLVVLGERQAEQSRLDQAADNFRAAMQTWTREKFASFWVRAQRGLGEALTVKAELAGGRDAMAQALEALRQAQAASKPGTHPQEDLALTADIVHAGAALAQPKGANRALGQAMDTLRPLLTPHWREEFPVEWAQGERALGEGYLALAAHDPSALQKAIEAFQAAQSVATEASLPFDWAKTEADRAEVLTRLGQQAQAVAAYDGALKVFREGSSPHYIALCEAGRARAAAHAAAH